MVSQGTSNWLTYSQVCWFTAPNWLILQSEECQSWCKESQGSEEWVGQTGGWRRAWRGSRMEKNGLSPPVAAASFWFSSSITKPLLTRDQITAVSGQLSHLCSCRRKASEASMASSLLQATMVGTQRELQERRQPGRKQRQHCYQDPATAIGVIGWYWLPQQGVQILMNTL